MLFQDLKMSLDPIFIYLLLVSVVGAVDYVDNFHTHWFLSVLFKSKYDDKYIKNIFKKCW